MRISDWSSDVCSSDFRRAHVRTHHQLHARGQEHVVVLEAVVHAVGDGTVVVEAGEDFLDLAHDVVRAGDVEEGFLLAGEGRVVPVLCGRGRTTGADYGNPPDLQPKKPYGLAADIGRG